MTALYFLVGKIAFFLLGPFILYDLVLYSFPFWTLPKLTSTLYKGTEFQQSQKILKDSFKKQKRAKPELLMVDTEFNNILVLNRHRRVWVVAGREFLASFSSTEIRAIFDELVRLYASEHLSQATIFSALHFTLRFWKPHKGCELTFRTENDLEPWLYLNYKIFHRLSLRAKPLPPHLMPCLFFPALGNYPAESYFSLYTFLRERLITSMRPTEAPPLEGEL